MAEQARVTRLDALESFRASLIVFLAKARRSVDEVADEVKRTRHWLQHEQRLHWETQVKKRQKALDQAQQELLSARLSEFVDTPSMQQMAVRKARRVLEEAQEKLRLVKIWNRDFDTQADPLVRKLESLRYYLDHELPDAVSFLSQAQRTLETYAETPLPGTSAPAPPAPGPAQEP